jgi:hypothetical protein
VQRQVDGFVGAVYELLGEDLVGVYLHGSPAFGCFNPARSDIDLLAVTKGPMWVETKRALARLVLDTSSDPCPIEVSFCTMAQLHPWRYPTQFDLHYSEDWRARFEETLADGAASEWNEQRGDDEDLAAHITITRLVGIRLLGPPIDEVFPEVPEEDYAASLYGDLLWEIEYLETYPVNCVLNGCRIWAYLAEKLIFSKDQGAVWALGILPDEHRAVVGAALAAYRGEGRDEDVGTDAAKQFADYVARRVRDVYEPVPR